MCSRSEDFFVPIPCISLGSECQPTVDWGGAQASAQCLLHDLLQKRSCPRPLPEPEAPNRQQSFEFSRDAQHGRLAQLPAAAILLTMGFTIDATAREEYVDRIKHGSFQSHKGSAHALLNTRLIHSVQGREMLAISQEEKSIDAPLPFPVPVVGCSKSILAPGDTHRHALRVGKHDHLSTLHGWYTSAGVRIVELVATMMAMSTAVRTPPSGQQLNQLPSMLMVQALQCCHPVRARARAAPLGLWRPPVLPLLEPEASTVLRLTHSDVHRLVVRKPRFETIHTADGDLTDYTYTLMIIGNSATSNTTAAVLDEDCSNMYHVQLKVVGDAVKLLCVPAVPQSGNKEGVKLTFHVLPEVVGSLQSCCTCGELVTHVRAVDKSFALVDKFKQQLLDAVTAVANTGMSGMQDSRFQTNHAIPPTLLLRAMASASMEGVQLQSMCLDATNL
jgi:hypothetical protein